ncbi:MAG: Rpn family recombination-promoting nuclease/putative transposase [Chloroherpetonaceae bacterium]
MRTDKLAYLWFQEVPQGFFALIGRDKSDAEFYDFKSVELKETSFRLDGVFIPQIDDYTYFVEVQFQRDENFYARLFAQVFLYLKQFSVRKWRVVVIYPTRSIEQKNLEGYQEILDTILVQRIYLDELPSIEALEDIVGIFKLIIEPKKRTIEVARQFAAKQTPYLNFIEKVIFYKFGNLTTKEILSMLSIREEFEEELKKTRAYQEIFREGELVGFKRGIKEGMEEGREMGIKEGIKEGLLKSIPTLRELGLSDEEIAKRLGLDIQDVKRVS